MESGKRVYRRFDEQFQQDAVALVLRGEKPQHVIAKDLGVSTGTLSGWKRKQLEKEGHVPPGKGHLSAIEEENRRLRKELRDMTEERDILKKAAAIFSRMPR